MPGSYAQDGDRIAVPAGADFSAAGSGTYRGVKIVGGVAVLCGANDAAFEGVLLDAPKLGETASIKTMATAKAVAGAAVASQALVTTDAAGRFVTATTGQRVHARAEAAAAASGDLFAIRLRPGLEVAP